MTEQQVGRIVCQLGDALECRIRGAAAFKLSPQMINNSDGPWGAGHSQAAVGIALSVLVQLRFFAESVED